jgi:hypothetical protein
MTPLLPSGWVSMFDRGVEKCDKDIIHKVLHYLFFDFNFVYSGLVKIMTSVPGVITQWKYILLLRYVIYKKSYS